MICTFLVHKKFSYTAKVFFIQIVVQQTNIVENVSKIYEFVVNCSIDFEKLHCQIN